MPGNKKVGSRDDKENDHSLLKQGINSATIKLEENLESKKLQFKSLQKVHNRFPPNELKSEDGVEKYSKPAVSQIRIVDKAKSNQQKNEIAGLSTDASKRAILNQQKYLDYFKINLEKCLDFRDLSFVERAGH